MTAATKLPTPSPIQSLIQGTKFGYAYKHYMTRGWRFWESWCINHNVDPLQAQSSHVVQFLEDHPNEQPHRLNKACKAIAFVYKLHNQLTPTTNLNVTAVHRGQIVVRPDEPPPTPAELIIESANCTQGNKRRMIRDWKPWDTWCETQGIDSLDAENHHVFQYLEANANLPLIKRRETCRAINFTYRQTGRPSPAHRITFDYHSNNTVPIAKIPLSQEGNRDYDNRIHQFQLWCSSLGKTDLPANPDDVLAFLEERAQTYSLADVRAIFYNINRYHAEAGFAGFARNPKILALTANLQEHTQQTERRLPGNGQAPATVRTKQTFINRWRIWCSDQQIKPHRAKPEHICQYLEYIQNSGAYDYIKSQINAIATTFPGKSPTDSQKVKAQLLRIKQHQAEHGKPPRKPTRKQSLLQQFLEHLPEAATTALGVIPPGITQEHIVRIIAARNAAISPSTQESYIKKVWIPFKEWLEEIGVPYMEAQPLHIITHLCLLGESQKPSTVDRARAGLVYCYNQLRPYDNPANHEIVKTTLKNRKKHKINAPEQVAPITQNEYALIALTSPVILSWEKPYQAEIRFTTDIALIGIMRDCLLRISEASAIRRNHITPWPDGAGRLLIPKSKNDPTSRGKALYVSSYTMDAINSMVDVLKKLGREPAPDDRLFPVEPQTIYRHIKDACALAGLKGRYGGHSPRVGMSLDLVTANASLIGMMDVARWKSSSMPSYYARNLEAGRNAVAAWYAMDPELGRIEPPPLSGYALTPPRTRSRRAA